MTSRLLFSALLLLGLAPLVPLVAGRVQEPQVSPRPRAAGPGRMGPGTPSPTAVAFRRQGGTPFRLPARRPLQRYGPPSPPVTVPVPSAPKPALILTGILWGAEPAALIRGLPGIEGEAVLRVGDSQGGIHVRAIREDSVELSGMDTSWVLQVGAPW